MRSRLPATPMDALTVSGALLFAVKTIHRCADIFGFWKYPSLKAAGDFEEMSLMDKFYWGYKSKNPIAKAEKGSQLESFFRDGTGEITLPDDFLPSGEVTFSAVGDVIKIDGLEHSRDHLYEKIAPLVFDSDISYANLESQLSTGEAGGYTFSEKETPPLFCTLDQYNTLKGHKGKQFSLFHTACNHTMDCGPAGLETTLEQLEKDDILDLGTNRTPEEQSQGRIIEKKGIKFGFISATLGLNGKPVPEGKDYVVNVVKFHSRGEDPENPDISLLEKQLAYCKEHKCDIIVASLHWGYEYEWYPRRRQVEWAHRLVEAGVDVIIGHHSHVIQPIEFYQPKRAPGTTAVIAYSLGNLTSSFSAPFLALSSLLNLTFVKGKLKGQEKTLIGDARVTPVVQTEQAASEDAPPVFRLETLDALKAAPGKAGEDRAYVSSIETYAEQILGGKWKK